MSSAQTEENELQVLHLTPEDHNIHAGKTNFCSRIISTNIKREFRELYRLAWPTVFTNVFVISLNTQSLVFSGQIGKTELATCTLALSFFSIFGPSIAIGMCSALETLCSQAYGAKNYKMVGVVLQRGICVMTIAMIIIGSFWLTVGHFLLIIGIEEEIARMVDKFIVVLLPILPPVFGCQLLIRYLGTQGIVRPTLWIGLICNVIAIGMNFLFVIYLKQGIWGVAITLVIVMYCNLILTIAYIMSSKIYRKTWCGWSFECLYNWREFICLSLPGMLMLCLEYWSFEIGAFLIARFGESSLAAHGVLLQLDGLTFMIPLGISVAASVCVGNSLGANKPSQAKLITKLSIVVNWICISVIVVVCVNTRRYIAMVFSNNQEVIELLIKTIPIMFGLAFVDSTQGVCSGIVRGCGRQRIGVVFNFISYDIIALPLGIFLAFVMDLRLAGMWWGLSGGLFVQATLYVTLISCTNWKKQADLAQKRTELKSSVHQSTPVDNKDLLMEPNSQHDKTKEDVHLVNGTSGENAVHLWLARTSSVHDLDRITMTTSIQNCQNQTKQKHRHSRKRIVCLRLIPLLSSILVLCGTLCVRFLVPLPIVNKYQHRNQTIPINGTNY